MVDSDRQADEEITPQMIAAGAEVLFQRCGDSLGPLPTLYQSLATEVWEAMARAYHRQSGS